MASDLLILYPHVQHASTRFIAASSFSGTPNEHEDHPLANTFSAPRWQLFRSDSDATLHTLIYDTGPFGALAHSFVWFSKLNIMRSYGLTIQIDFGGGSDEASITDFTTLADINALTLIGPNSQDYVHFVPSNEGPYRYYRFKFSCASSFEMAIGKLASGVEIDLGTSPDVYEPDASYDSRVKFESSVGASILGRTSSPRLEFNIEWMGVSNANLNLFYNNIFQQRYRRTFLLYASSYLDILRGNKCVHVALVSASTDNDGEKSDFNNLRTRWVQVLG